MKINWGLVIALFLLVGIGAHALRTAPVREHSTPIPLPRPADVTEREQTQIPPTPNEPIAGVSHENVPLQLPSVGSPAASTRGRIHNESPIPPLKVHPALPMVPRSEELAGVHPGKPKAGRAGASRLPLVRGRSREGVSYQRVRKDGSLGKEVECAEVRPLTESEKAAYENSGEWTLFVCLN